MFNSSSFKTFKIASFLICIVFFNSCKKETLLAFSETTILEENETFIEVNIPKAEGGSDVAKKINETLNSFGCSVLNIDASQEKKNTIEESIIAFNEAYKAFNKLLISEFPDDFPRWEALVDGEVSYQDENLVSIAMNGVVNTGSASSNMVFKFLNFDLSNGKSLSTEDLINNTEGFKDLVQKYYIKELITSQKEGTAIESENFKLPETLGFNEDGVIIIYDNFEFGNFTKELIEFTIPYGIANPYLTF